MSSRRRREQEESDYVKYLKYRQSGFQVGATDKTVVWYPTRRQDQAYTVAEVLKDDGKTFTVRTEEGEEKTQPKNEKTWLGVNPPKFDGVEDMAELGYLNEPAVLHNLKKRYEVELFHTYSGLFLVVVNPYKRLPIYTPQMIDIYRGRPRDKVAPHIFAISDGAYRAMLQQRQNQSMLITGESGAGKTENTKKVIQYLTAIAGRAEGGTLEQQMLEFNPILEAFGNAKTNKNNNSSRFGKFIELQFNAGGQIAGAHTNIYLLEKSRVVAQGAGERNFHIFYQILSRTLSDDLKQRLRLTRPQDYAFLNKNSVYTVDGMDDSKEFEHSIQAFNILNITEEERFSIFQVLSAILHLGNLPFAENAKEVAGLEDDREISIAAELLGVPGIALKIAILSPKIKAGNEYVSKALNKAKASASRDALCKALYGRLFLWIVRKINQTLSHKEKTALWIGVLDISGFEIFQINSLEQLCINYTNEKLQQFFNHHMFTLEQEEYEREKIEWSFENYGMDLQDTIDLIEKKPMGIFPLLDEQTVFPDADDTSFTKKLHITHDAHRNFRKPRFEANNFKILHYAGEVEYQTAGWLEKNRDPLEEDLSNLLKQSANNFICGLFDEGLAPTFASSTPAKEEQGTSTGSRRLSTGRQKGTGATFITVANQYKEQLSHLMDMLKSTNPHFIRCIIPNLQQRPGVIVDSLVLEQLKCNGVLEGIRIARKGWPNRLKYDEFLKRYFLLKPGATPTAASPKDAVKDLVEHLIKIEPTKVLRDQLRFGLTKIFFRTGQLAAIEQLREALISRLIISIQAGARAFLARRAYDKMREQTVSAKILQRNIRAWLEIKNWAWWNLYIKARPLITQRNFQKEIDDLQKQIKQLTKDLETVNAAMKKLTQEKELAEEDADKLLQELNELKRKYKDLEVEKTDLEEDNALLQKKVSGLEEELQEETGASNELLAQKKALENEKAELKANLEDEEKLRKSLQEAKAKVEAERNDWHNKYEDEVAIVEALKKKEDSLNVELRETKDALLDAEGIAETLRNKLKTTERTLDSVRAELEAEQKSKAELDRQKKKADEELALTRASLEEEKSGREAALTKAKQLAQQLDEARAEADSLKAKANSLEKTLKGAKDTSRDLDEQLEDERVVRANVERQNKVLENKLQELETAVANLESSKNEAAAQARSLRSQLDEAKRQLEEAEANVARLERERRAAQDELVELQAELDAEKESGAQARRKLNARIQELTTALETAPTGTAKAEDIKKLEDEITRLEDDLTLAEEGKLRAEKAAESAALQLDDAKQEVEDAHRKIDRLTKDLAKLKGDLDEARNLAEEETNAKNLLDSNNRRLMNELDELKRKLSKETADRSRLNDQRGALQRDVDNLKSDRDSLERRTRDAERLVRELRAQLEDVQGRFDDERRARVKAADDSRDLRKLLLEREKANAELLGKITSNNEAEKDALEDEIAELQEKNKQLASRILDLETKLAD
jgi:myosin heavy subunit